MVRITDQARTVPADWVFRLRHGPQGQGQVDLPSCRASPSLKPDSLLTILKALDGLPVLRRLTVNNDEKHDYLSRGATLQIRDTGAFAVYGPEDRGKVEWKFEYLFTPRISTSTGEVVPNEKVSNLSRKHRFVP